ncbi:MAG: hypothetical protein R3Y29_07515 [bacterium]
MNKDEVIGRYEYQEVESKEVAILTENIRLPIFISDNLISWLDNRVAPLYRKYTQEIIQEFSLDGMKDLINFSNLLSLTDTFWVQKVGDSLSWGDINLFKSISSGSIPNSSLLTTDGLLPKYWVVENQQVYLIKEGSTGSCNAGREPESEVLASQVLRTLGYNHTPYELGCYNNQNTSKCPLITSPCEQAESLIHASCYLKVGINQVDKIRDFCKGVDQECLDDFNKLIIFDYLSINSDRHMNNLAFIIDAYTYKIKGLAPIYDNGVGMLCYFMLNDKYQTLEQFLELYIPKLYDSFIDEAIISKCQLGDKHNLEYLLGFSFDITNSDLNINQERIEFIQSFIRERATALLTL